MTQAFNLAQLANNLNTSGQLDATDGLSGLVATANLASGSASSSTFLRGDQTWSSIGGRIAQIVNTGTIVNPGAGTTSTGGTRVSQYSLSITPTASTSRIIIMGAVGVGAGGSGSTMAAFYQPAYSTNGGSTWNYVATPSIPNTSYSTAAVGLNSNPSINNYNSFHYYLNIGTTNTILHTIWIYSNGTNSVFTTDAGAYFTALEITA